MSGGYRDYVYEEVEKLLAEDQPLSTGHDTVPNITDVDMGFTKYAYDAAICPRLNPHFSFSKALELLKSGNRVARAGWNGKNMWLELQKPDAHSKMTLPYIYIEYPVGHPAYPNGSRVPWLASQTDLLPEDYYYVPRDERA